VSLTLRYLIVYQPTPQRLILNRWVRWLTIGVFGGLVLSWVGLDDRPFWKLFAFSFLGWFLVENVFRWLEIKALSFSDYPLFPKYAANTSGDEWPVHPAFFQLRDWLKKNGFQKEVSLKATIVE